MKTILLTQSQLVTCRDLVKSKITDIKINIRHSEMYQEEALHYDDEIKVEKEQEKIDRLNIDLCDMKKLLVKFDNEIKIKVIK